MKWTPDSGRQPSSHSFNRLFDHEKLAGQWRENLIVSPMAFIIWLFVILMEKTKISRDSDSHFANKKWQTLNWPRECQIRNSSLIIYYFIMHATRRDERKRKSTVRKGKWQVFLSKKRNATHATCIWWLTWLATWIPFKIFVHQETNSHGICRGN